MMLFSSKSIQLPKFLSTISNMKILKFGGSSLSNASGLQAVTQIVKNQQKKNQRIAVVVSARENTTNQLLNLLHLAKNQQDYQSQLEKLVHYQVAPIQQKEVIQPELELLHQLLKGVFLLKEYSQKTSDLAIAQGELMSAKVVACAFQEANIEAQALDARSFLKTNNLFGNADVLYTETEQCVQSYFDQLNDEKTPVITGFIGSTLQNETTTLGRNGSNYTSTLLAHFLSAQSVKNYTNVDGIYTANPALVPDAQVIRALHFSEANELASFGASILHPKTIGPLVAKSIPLYIKNTFAPLSVGTRISHEKTPHGIKSISVQENVVLITIEGKGLLGKVGIDARIFTVLQQSNISVGIVSQGSSERGVSFVISKEQAKKAKKALKEAFERELEQKDIDFIRIKDHVAVVTTVGQNIEHFASSIAHLKQNKIPILLINNTYSGNNISLVIPSAELKKALNIIHGQIFGAVKTIHIAIIGKGKVGSALIDQIVQSSPSIEEKHAKRLKIFAISGSQNLLLDKNGIFDDWRDRVHSTQQTEAISEAIIQYAQQHHLENLVAIDNTASFQFIKNYGAFIENGFDLISSNKIANTQKYSKYKKLRKLITTHKKEYLYETNVGAGLPIIDTIKLLHASGENITQIRGVFSGSLSYLFNEFSVSDQPFYHFLSQAMELGYTEPDPREDLSGSDVARKLLILARELELENEFEDIDVQALIPKEWTQLSKEEFLSNQETINQHFANFKSELKKDHVLRYVAQLTGDLQQSTAQLRVSLQPVLQSSTLGNLQGSDTVFEIFTESYGNQPITIMGAGAGATVTARGVFGDLLRIANKTIDL